MIIVAGLSVDYEIEVRMIEDNPSGLDRAEIERVVGNQYNRLLRQQYDSKAISASGSTTTADRGEEKRRPHNRFEGNCFSCGRKGHRAEDCRNAKKIEKSGDAPADKKSGGRGKCYVCGSEEHFARKHCGLCRSLEHRTRGCEKRGAEKGAMPAKLNVLAKKPTAAMMGAARGDRKEEWEPDSGEIFHISHSRAGMIAYKKAPAGTTVEVANGTILPVDGFGTVEVDLDQPGTTTKPVKIVSIAYVPGLSRNLLSTRKAVEQWGKPLVCYKTKAVLGFTGEESLVFNFCLRKGLFSATGVRRTPSQGAALALAAKTWAIRVGTTGQWRPRADVRRSSSQGAALALGAKMASGALHRCDTKPEAKGSAGDGGESARCDEGTPRARGPRRVDTGGSIGSREGDTGDTIGPQRGDTGGDIGPQTRDTGGAIGIRRGDTGGALDPEKGTR